MDCEACGCYRPSWEVDPTFDPTGHLVMACATCRRSITAPETTYLTIIEPSVIGSRMVPAPTAAP